jgi:two-component system, OmpR family, heavy metal sensor histidine kinase CusS
MSSKRKTNRSWSLAARLTTWYSLASFILILFATGILYWGLVAILNRSEDLFLADKVHVLRAILRDKPDDVNRLKWEAVGEVELESSARRYAQFYARLVDENGNNNISTQQMDVLLAPALFMNVVPADAEPSQGTEIHGPQHRSFRVLAAAARVGPYGQKTWVIQVALDRAHDSLLLASYKVWMLAVLMVATIVCPLIGYRIARRGIRPVQDITETARRTGSATLSARIDPSGYPVELAALADTLNAMLDRLDDSFRRLSQFSADIAHELRTPVNNMRGEAEVALSRARSVDEYRETLTSCLEESVRLSDLITSLLFLARAENPGTQLERESVQVHKELAAVLEYYEAAAGEARIAMSVAAGEEIAFSVNRGLLQQAIGNLVVNSLAHTPPGGTVTLRAGACNGDVRIEVADTGAGIPDEDLPRVFDRFYRVTQARSSQYGSAGLGLAIVKGIVTLHGGRTEIESAIGRGTRVILIFPSTSVQDSGEIRTRHLI